jgi:hypothetical protein
MATTAKVGHPAELTLNRLGWMHNVGIELVVMMMISRGLE